MYGCYILFLILVCFTNKYQLKYLQLFHGKDFKGWEGDTVHTWQIEKGAWLEALLLKQCPTMNLGPKTL